MRSIEVKVGLHHIFGGIGSGRNRKGIVHGYALGFVIGLCGIYKSNGGCPQHIGGYRAAYFFLLGGFKGGSAGGVAVG